MNMIFGGIFLFSILFALLTGRMEPLSRAVMESAGDAVALTISLLGVLCLWSGLMKIAQQSGLTHVISRIISPVTKRLFKGLDPRGEAMNAISMNLVANLFGIGNAATPLGIRAMCEMAKEERATDTATANMVMFVVLNTASLQLIPTTTALLRMKEGAAQPLDILPAVWLSSIACVTVGVTAVRLLAPPGRQKS
jgi:spore maturation protein A